MNDLSLEIFVIFQARVIKALSDIVLILQSGSKTEVYSHCCWC